MKKVTYKDNIAILNKWVENHPCDRETFWHVQNAIGDLLGWPKWFIEWSAKTMAFNYEK